MLKKLIILLPLVWVVALGVRLAHPPRPQVDVASQHARPAILPPQLFVVKSKVRDIMVYADLTGRDLTAVSLGASRCSLSGFAPMRRIAFQRRPVARYSGYTPIVIPARTFRHLDHGFYPIRFAMSDGTSACLSLIVVDRPIPGTISDPPGAHVPSHTASAPRVASL